MEKNPELLAYCAGLFDGEGTVTMVSEAYQHSFRLRVILYNSHKPSILLFHSLWGGNINLQAKGSKTGIKYTAKKDYWSVSYSENERCYHLLCDLIPYIMIKEKQFALAKSYLEQIMEFRQIRGHSGRTGKGYTGVERALREEVRNRMTHLNRASEDMDKVQLHIPPKAPRLFEIS